MVSVPASTTLAKFQRAIKDIYGLPDDRLFSLSDLVSNQERFTMRALKGIRKGDEEKLELNLLIAFSWLMALANRLHIEVEDSVWRRFPRLCSYCGERPCACKKTKPASRIQIVRKPSERPKSLQEFQVMFAEIYPPASRTLPDVGVHLAEEMGELSEAVHYFQGEHKSKQFEALEDELADYVSCVFGVANSAKIPMAEKLAKMFANNCHVCHEAPCVCSFSSVAQFSS